MTVLAVVKSGQVDLVTVTPEYALEEVAGMNLQSFKTADNQ